VLNQRRNHSKLTTAFKTILRITTYHQKQERCDRSYIPVDPRISTLTCGKFIDLLFTTGKSFFNALSQRENGTLATNSMDETYGANDEQRYT
jgi:hypothetical protein